MPVERSPGAKVIGGTLNRSGMLRFQATRVGKETKAKAVVLKPGESLEV